MGIIRVFTTAPADYDYWYTSTLLHITVADEKDGLYMGCRNWRLIEATDEDRFKNFQTPRYASGLNLVVAVGSEEAASFGLPSQDELDKLMAPSPEYKLICQHLHAMREAWKAKIAEFDVSDLSKAYDEKECFTDVITAQWDDCTSPLVDKLTKPTEERWAEDVDWEVSNLRHAAEELDHDITQLVDAGMADDDKAEEAHEALLEILGALETAFSAFQRETTEGGA